MAIGIDGTTEIRNSGGPSREAERKHTVAEREHIGGITLRALLEGIPVRAGLPAELFPVEAQHAALQLGNLQIHQVANDSRKVQPGALFVAIHGNLTNYNL